MYSDIEEQVLYVLIDKLVNDDEFRKKSHDIFLEHVRINKDKFAGRMVANMVTNALIFKGAGFKTKVVTGTVLGGHALQGDARYYIEFAVKGLDGSVNIDNLMEQIVTGDTSELDSVDLDKSCECYQ